MDSDVDIGTLPIPEWQFSVRHIFFRYRNNRCRCRMSDIADIKIDVDAHLCMGVTFPLSSLFYLRNARNRKISLRNRQISPILPLDHFLQPMLLKKCKERFVTVKFEFHFFVLFLKPKRTKIFAFNDFRVFFNSAHFVITQIDQFFYSE